MSTRSFARRAAAGSRHWGSRAVAPMLVLALLVQSIFAPSLTVRAQAEKSRMQEAQVVIVPAGTELTVYTTDEL